MPYTRRVVMGAMVPAASAGQQRSGVAVLLAAAASVNSQYNSQDPDNLAAALQARVSGPLYIPYMFIHVYTCTHMYVNVHVNAHTCTYMHMCMSPTRLRRIDGVLCHEVRPLPKPPLICFI